jgi:sulfur-carrier protein adenylyltransferase/sulfurtransferase
MPNKSAQELFDEAKARVRQVSADDAMRRRAQGDPVTFLDVRDAQEANLGKIPGAVHLSRGTLEGKVEALVPRDAEIVIYCASGNRSALAAETMQQMGYTNVASLAGGFRAWVE